MGVEVCFSEEFGLAGRLVIDDERYWVLRDAVARLEQEADFPPPQRLAYAAVHLVMVDGYRQGQELGSGIDWVATRELRQRVAGSGFGIAEAMDTAQRFQLDMPTIRRLVESTAELGLPQGFIAGAGTEPLPGDALLHEVEQRVIEQVAWIQSLGGEAILLPMPQLLAHGCEAGDFVAVYRRIAQAARKPVFVHWLGPMFAPGLAGYFPDDSFAELLALEPEAIAGAKLSVLNPELECRLRREMAGRGQVMLTGDDHNFAELIAGQGPVRHRRAIAGLDLPLGDFSHALLGVFDAVHEPAGLGLRALACGDLGLYEQCMRPCELLGQVLFEEPVSAYKSGLAFLAWLSGAQETFALVDDAQYLRSVPHLLRVVELASQAGVFHDAAAAALRLEAFLASDLSPFAEPDDEPC